MRCHLLADLFDQNFGATSRKRAQPHLKEPFKHGIDRETVLLGEEVVLHWRERFDVEVGVKPMDAGEEIFVVVEVALSPQPPNDMDFVETAGKR